ncbi:hypothetical protein BW14_06860 [Bifidobacterium sp. UTBIF-68]|uniref:hypothetical protein n=1 Tax=Bifidobacterium sp. UTBIF-68 TaxID=1465262 RepID=UPI0011282000|nr:hypothetical protein [Bifidobacterium sp. UTBIF-68]TPF92879.1 hypothetical protein BW14_06860 [Bifidobacterium sp. UTBIF-68]
MTLNEEPKNAADTAKAEEAKPETGENKLPAQDSPQTEDKTDTGRTADDELAKWKAMSRKNEKQAEANLKQVQQVQAELAQARADNARLTAKNKYPQISDEALTLCDKTDPDEIAAWAEQYAKLNPINAGVPAPKPKSDPLARKTLDLAENPQGEFNPKPKRGDAYKRSQERQNARRRNRNKTN